MFDAVRETERIIEFIRNYYQANHLKGAVLGVSGGKDSGVVAALMCAAIGPENVVGLTLPCHSKPIDAYGARLVADRYGFELLNIDLTDTYDTFRKQIALLGDYDEEALKNSDINIKPRMRMMSVYYMAALLSATRGGTYIVPGTSNACELYVGYFTKGGDSVYDIAPIYSLTVEEVIKVGEVLDVPREVLYRTPDDGLSGMSDEDKLGVSYAAIANVINGLPVSEQEAAIIDRLHRGSRHKFSIPVYRKED